MIAAVNFFKGVIEELKKLQIPSKKEVYVTTLIMMVVVSAVSLVILAADFVISKLITLVFGL